jgi:hypothetical protein
MGNHLDRHDAVHHVDQVHEVFLWNRDRVQELFVPNNKANPDHAQDEVIVVDLPVALLPRHRLLDPA